MFVKWNDQPGRTFAGIAAGLSSLACQKNGNEEQVIELMLRFEPGTKSPIVFPPLVVGERVKVEADRGIPHDIECEPMKKAFELTENWSSDDDLELTGPASWFALKSVDGALRILLDTNVQKPSSVGRYHFAR